MAVNKESAAPPTVAPPELYRRIGWRILPLLVCLALALTGCTSPAEVTADLLG